MTDRTWSYYMRAQAIQYMVKGFLQSLRLKSAHKQIVSLGAGFDTLFFSLSSEGFLKDTKYFEIDFPEVAKQKASLILQHKELFQGLGKTSAENKQWLGGGIDSEKYTLLGCNLKNRSLLENHLLKCGLDTSLPTLLLSEVVLTYMDPPESSTAIIGWAADFFKSAMFVMFEQVSPHDPFGIKMIDHFKNSIGAPLFATEAFPTRQSQKKRFMEEGWPLVRCPTLNFFYYDTLSEEEKSRLENVEPFDEFEEWHLMCSHYIVLAAFKGICEDICEELFSQLNVGTYDHSSPLKDVQCTVRVMEVLPSRDKLKRQGHTATPLSDGTVFLTGGFGLENGKHMRLDGVQLLRTVEGSFHCGDILPDSERTLGGRMFHTATRLKDDNILLYGGRKSPSNPCEETILLSLHNKHETKPLLCTEDDFTSRVEFSETRYKQTIFTCQGDIPQLRWRHTATHVTLPDGSENVLIFGGRSSSCLALGECYLLNTKSKTWKKFAIRGDAAAPRHSHTACVWDNHVVLAGGLDAGLQALSIVQIMEIDVNSVKLRTLSVDPPLPPRYSHTAHVVDDNLVLIGGVTPISSHPPGVIVLHLKNLTWKSYTLPACLTPSIPLMLHNHCSVCWEDSQGIMVLGGGGNCFSFGTHFNDGPVFLDLSPLREAVAFKCA
ncbi:tRNA wybutosine-synthesizing protein 4 [Stylophora pistillata]|uniref:tRNA wybutosine-synthesizing protein 4 n=1 Tax=Stylophora pistillata TaxID=50429 RepID=A0A2B4SXT0_STYPI|nr:tRNA wybutosine-synthesizing protein 4 [Stylophora pistillata]